MTSVRLWLTRAAPGTARPLGRQLLRLAVARAALVSHDALGEAVRSCLYCDDPHHGPPRWPGTGVWASMSRAGSVVVVAAMPSPSPSPSATSAEHGLGVDVVVGDGRLVPRLVDLLSAEERGDRQGDADLLRLWARKEAAVKATGLGLALPVNEVTVRAATDGPSTTTAGANPSTTTAGANPSTTTAGANPSTTTAGAGPSTTSAGRDGQRWWAATLDGDAWDRPARSHSLVREPPPRRLLGTDVDVSTFVGPGHHAAVALAVDTPVTVVVSDAAELLDPS